MRSPFAIPIFIALIFMVGMLPGCVSGGDPESVDTVDRGWGLYERDVNGGLTPAEAVDLVADLTDRYADATKPADPDEGASDAEVAVHETELAVWEVKVDTFREDLSRLTTDQLSVDVVTDFFKAALRYELSKFPKGKSPDVEHDISDPPAEPPNDFPVPGPADDP